MYSEFCKQEVVRSIFHVGGEFHLTSSSDLFSWIFLGGNRQKETVHLLVIKNKFCDKTKNVSLCLVPSAWDSKKITILELRIFQTQSYSKIRFDMLI